MIASPPGSTGILNYDNHTRNPSWIVILSAQFRALLPRNGGPITPCVLSSALSHNMYGTVP
jgi:hypothetical protein